MTGADVPAAMPERVGGYELLFPIGSGGMGTVYLARRELFPGVMRNFAIKLMHSELRANPEVGPQLMEEAKFAARIHHPNVVSVWEAGDSPHGVYLVMDHIEGDTLAGVIRALRKRGDTLPVRIACKILRDALAGLHAAHELKDDDGHLLDLVHRDFSPHNILVGVDGVSLLTDFGIAKALSNISTTATGIVKGKIGYMAPEQARGERVDRRSDVWAAGVVAWESLSLKRLFRGNNDAATLLKIVSGKRPPRVSSVREDVPPTLDEAIAGALEHKPNRRLASAQTLRERIEAAVSDSGGIATEEEVGAFMRELVGPKIAERRQRIDSVLGLREQIADLATLEEQPTDSTLGTPPNTSDFIEPTRTRAVMTTGSGSVTRPRRPIWGVMAAIACVGVGGLAYLAMFTNEPEPARNPTEDPAPPAELVLRISANEPIAQLTIDDRTIVVPEATKTLDLPIGETAPKRLVAITVDGRKVDVALQPSQHELKIDFEPIRAAPSTSVDRPPSPRPSLRPVRPQPATRVPPKPPSDDGLADSPYGSK